MVLAAALTASCSSTNGEVAADSVPTAPSTSLVILTPPSTSLVFQDGEDRPTPAVKQCMDFIVLSASIGDPEFQLRWIAVGQDLDRLRTECERAQVDEPLLFADWVARFALAKAFLEGGVPPTVTIDSTVAGTTP